MAFISLNLWCPLLCSLIIVTWYSEYYLSDLKLNRKVGEHFSFSKFYCWFIQCMIKWNICCCFLLNCFFICLLQNQILFWWKSLLWKWCPDERIPSWLYRWVFRYICICMWNFYNYFAIASEKFIVQQLIICKELHLKCKVSSESSLISIPLVGCTVF